MEKTKTKTVLVLNMDGTKTEITLSEAEYERLREVALSYLPEPEISDDEARYIAFLAWQESIDFSTPDY